MNAEDIFGVIPRALAAGGEHEHEVAALLKHRHTEAYSPGSINTTPLALVTEAEHTEIVRLLLGRHEIDADSVDDEGCTPLAWAGAMGPRTNHSHGSWPSRNHNRLLGQRQVYNIGRGSPERPRRRCRGLGGTKIS